MESKDRKTHRLKGFDYSSSGIYFVTVCVKDKRCLLSQIVDSGDLDAPKIKLSSYGKIAYNNILAMNKIYGSISVKYFVIMPNHIHMLIRINEDAKRNVGSPFPTNAKISRYIGAFKRYFNKETKSDIWQKSFYDHIIRDENDYIEHLEYIKNNPQKWLNGKDEYL